MTYTLNIYQVPTIGSKSKNPKSKHKWNTVFALKELEGEIERYTTKWYGEC